VVAVVEPQLASPSVNANVANENPQAYCIV
jgi:hypothetical protein